MSSIFDSSVHHMRQNAPFASPHISRFMSEKAFEQWGETGVAGDEAEVVFKVYHRPDVASRLWWTMEWYEHGEVRSASAQEWSLCLWRAVQIHKNLQRQKQLEANPTNRHGFFEERGYENGAGI